MTTNPHKSRAEGDELFERCPVSQAFEQIGSKWRLVVMHSIHMKGEQRFTELQENTSARSSTLSRVLEELEELGLINRRLEDRPIATYYDLTEKGRSLAGVFGEIEAWADDWTEAESTYFEPQP
jgi:DNA-binding HxlR family transcriptional regulator